MYTLAQCGQEGGGGGLGWSRARGRGQLAPHRVPDLQLDLLVADLDHACPKLHTNRQVVHGLEALVGELQQQAALADAWVDDGLLESPMMMNLNMKS